MKPSYPADLNELTRKLGAFPAVSKQNLTSTTVLDLRGSAEATALLEILGNLSPLANRLAEPLAKPAR